MYFIDDVPPSLQLTNLRKETEPFFAAIDERYCSLEFYDVSEGMSVRLNPE